MSNHRFSAATTGLPVERMNEIYDCLALALDATEGERIERASLNEARDCMQTALHTASIAIEDLEQ